MNPALYRYRNSESVIKAMDGYTPAEGWEPLYDQAEIDADRKAERDTLLELLVFAASMIKSEYPEYQWDEYRIPEIDAIIVALTAARAA